MRICPACGREYPPDASLCSEDGVALVALSPTGASKPEDLVGQTVEGRYRVEGVLGKGGMGVVYACRHVVVGKKVAMKVLRAGVERGEGVLARFIREAQTANAIKSRHIAETFDFGQLPSGSFFVVMELLEGEDLTHALKRGALGRRDLLHVFAQVAETLQLAHDRGVIHRDLKPDNVFLVEEGADRWFVKLLDFGIAKVLDEGVSNFTETGVILGTPYYMSPEQARGEQIDHRSDVYALGVMMYRAFTGRLPFVADSTLGVLTRHLTELPELPSRITSIDPGLERVILRCLEKVPSARFQGMREVADALRALAAGPSRPLVRDDPTVQEGAAARLAEGSAPLADSHARIAASGAHVAASGAHVATSGAHVATSGAHLATSGEHLVTSGAHLVTSGAYVAASGGHAAYASGPSSQPPPASSGAHAPASSGVHTPLSIPPHATPPSMRALDPAYASGAHASQPPPPLSVRAPPGETSRVFATSGAHAPVGRSPWVLVVGALAMIVVGAGLAAFIFRLGRSSVVVAPSVVAVAAPPSGAPVAPEPTTTATFPGSSTSALAAPSTNASSEPSPPLKGRLPAAPPPPTTKPTATPAPSAEPTTRRAPEIRSPFD